MSPERLAAAALFALLLLQPLWHGLLAPPRQLPRWLVLAVAMLPLLPPLLAWLAGRPRALFWGGLVALFYFCHGVAEAWTTPAVRALAMAELLLAVVVVGGVGWSGLARRRAARREGG